MCLKNELCQVQTQTRKDILTIQALELAKSNFAGMQNQLEKFLAKIEEYRAQFPTLQDKLTII
jgi:hypothetical protein